MGRRRREMAELRALHREVWGYISYERHRDGAKARVRRELAIGLLFAIVVGVLAYAVTNGPGTEDSARRGVVPSNRVSTSRAAPSPTPTTRKVTRTSRPTRPASRAATTAATRRRPRALAHTGGASAVLAVLGVALVGAGVGLLRKSKSTPVRAS